MNIRLSTSSRLLSRMTSLFALALAVSVRAHASAAGTLPWEAPMTAIATSLTGPVAYAIGLIGMPSPAEQCSGVAS